MKSEMNAQILDNAVAEKIPDSVNIAPRVLARIRSEKAEQVFWSKRKHIDYQRPIGKPMKPIMRLTTILLVILAILALSGAVYAVYRWIGDPGIQAVQDAGLTTDINITAQPTVLPTSTPRSRPQPATSDGTSQTIEGVTLTLDWVYLETNLLMLGMNFTDLPADTSLDAPTVTFAGVTAEQPQGYSQNILSAENRTVYISYQHINVDSVGGKVDLGIDVPLVQQVGDQQTALAQFHFDLADVPVYTDQSVQIQQTDSVRRNGVEVRLESVRVMPATTDVVACYDFPTPDGAWNIQEATVQIGNGPEERFQQIDPLSDIQDDACVRLSFAQGNAGGDTRLIFRVHTLAAPSQPEITGPWEFYVDLPVEEIIPGMAGPAPTVTPSALGELTIEGVTMTLDWVFADVKRVSFGYTITGLPDNPDAAYLSGSIIVNDEQGNQIGSMGGGSTTAEWVEGRAGVIKGTWSKVLLEPLQQQELTISIDATLDGSGPVDSSKFIAYLPGEQPSVVPDRLVGTFHFDARTAVYPAMVVEPKQTVEANGIAMRLEWAELTPSYTNLILCYPKPSARDWMTGSGVTLKAGSFEAPVNGYSLLSDADYGGMIGSVPPSAHLSPVAAGERCVWIDFLLGHSDTADTLTLTIPAIEQSMPEAIPDADLKAAQEKLKAQGIEVDYTVYSAAGGGGGGGPTFTKIPDGMDWQEVFRRYMEALGYLHDGPWTFEIAIP